MSWITNILSGGAAQLVGKAGEIVDQLHLSGEEKQKFPDGEEPSTGETEEDKRDKHIHPNGEGKKPSRLHDCPAVT